MIELSGEKLARVATFTPNKLYTYSGIHLMPSFKWKLQKKVTTQKKYASTSPISLKQLIVILDTIIIVCLLCNPIFQTRHDKILRKLTKIICNILKNIVNILTHLSHKDFGTNVSSVLLEYKLCIGQ